MSLISAAPTAVTPAKAGGPLFPIIRSGIPAFAGMTILWLLALLFLATPAAAQTFPELTGRVVDQANLLSPAQEQALAQKSQALEEQTKRQFVIATVNSLEGQEIEDYGYRLGRHWGIGSAEEDDGIILLVAPNEKKVRIETGYGAEGFLPDILAGRIIRNTILPRFREGDMAGGIVAGADAIIEQVSLPPEEAQSRAAEAAAQEAAQAEGFSIVPVVIGGLIFLFVMLSMARRVSGSRYRRGEGKKRRRGGGFDAGDAAILLWGLSALSNRGRGGGWGGGGGFGGFGGGGGFGGFSGGGGGFGGGGASGGW